MTISRRRRSTGIGQRAGTERESGIGTSWNSVNAAIASVEAGQNVDLEGQGNPRDLVAHARDDLADHSQR